MMFPTLTHTMDRMRRLGRLIESEARHPHASNLRLLRLKALFLKAQLRLAHLTAQAAPAMVPVRVPVARPVRLAPRGH